MKKITLTLLLALFSMPFLKAQKMENTATLPHGIVLFSPTPIFFLAIAFEKENNTQVAENQSFKKQKQSKWAAFKAKMKQYKVLLSLLGFGAFWRLTVWRRKQLAKRHSSNDASSCSEGICTLLCVAAACVLGGAALAKYVFIGASPYFLGGIIFVVGVIALFIISKKKKKKKNK
jgi:hypothetical protein